MIRQQISYNHDNIFITDGRAEIRYGDFAVFHRHLQSKLAEIVRNKLTVGINTENRLQAVLWMVNCWLMNIPFVPFHPDHTEPLQSFQPNIFVDQIADLQNFLARPDLFESGSRISKVSDLSSNEYSGTKADENDTDPFPDTLFDPFLHPEDAIFCGLLTSGSSGELKKVPLRRRQLIAAASNTVRAGQLTLPGASHRSRQPDLSHRSHQPDPSHRSHQVVSSIMTAQKVPADHLRAGKTDLWGNCLPLYHAGGLIIIFRALLTGTGIFLWDRFSAETVIRDLAACSGIRNISFVPTMLNRLLEYTNHASHTDHPTSSNPDHPVSFHPEHPASTQPGHPASSRSRNAATGNSLVRHSLRCMLVGGGPAPVGLIQRARKQGWPVVFSYGMTETCGQIASQEVNGISPADSVGKPFPDHVVTVRNDRGRKVPAGKSGTIWIKGPQVFSGYLTEAAELWKNRPIGDCNTTSGERDTTSDQQHAGPKCNNRINTGDIGHYDNQGNLYIEARRTDLVISGGVNIRPAEIENILLACPLVSDTGVTGIPDDEWGQRLIALIVPAANTGDLSGPDLETAVAKYLATRLKSHQRPKSICLVKAIPRTGIGKIRRNALLDLAIDRLAGK